MSAEFCDPPDYFNADQRSAWRDLVAECPDLELSDRVFIELTSATLSRYRKSGECGDVARQAIKNVLRPMLRDCLVSASDARGLLEIKG